MRRARAIDEATRDKAHPLTTNTKAGVRHIHRDKACSVCVVRDVKLQLYGSAISSTIVRPTIRCASAIFSFGFVCVF
jgi:hypothetical protein